MTEGALPKKKFPNFYAHTMFTNPLCNKCHCQTVNGKHVKL